MRLSLLLLFLLLLVGTAVSGQTNLEQERMAAINPHWKNISLSAEQSQQVRQCLSTTSLIQLHLKWVAEHLAEATKRMDLDEATSIKRQNLIETLTDYYQRRLFPINTVSREPTPVFVDELGTHCAVGYLLHVSGYDDVVGKISEENNLGYVNELNLDYPMLGIWAEAYGFTIDELAWIQPEYVYFCNPQIMIGDVIQLTCPGNCTGAFLADPLDVIQESNVIVSIIGVFQWSSGEWQEIDNPDCLCPGLYKQEFIVYSNDTNYILGIEIELYEPEPIVTYENAVIAPGFCNTSFEPESQGGNPPYTYAIYDMDGNVYGLDALCDGAYSLVTTDSAGCSISQDFDLLTWEEDCQLFCVTDIQLIEPGSMAVTLYFDAPADAFINYPYFDLVFDENESVIADGDLNFFGQFGGTSQTYILQTTLDSLSDGFTASLSFLYNDQFCTLKYPCTTTSIHSLESVEINIYPNPFSTEVTIQLDEPLSAGEITLYNMQGQKVTSYTWLEGDQFSITRNGLPSGPYFILVSAPDKRAMGRCIIMD